MSIRREVSLRDFDNIEREKKRETSSDEIISFEFIENVRLCYIISAALEIFW